MQTVNGVSGLIVALVVMNSLISPLYAQQATIPALINRLRPEPVRLTQTREMQPIPLRHVVDKADLIVRGSVRVRRTYLSDDQTTLFTEYVLAPTQFVAQRALVTQVRPGLPEIVIRKWGGTTVIEGVQVSATDMNLPRLPVNAPLVLFLTYDSTTRQYTIVDEIAGAFSETPEGISPLLTPPMDLEQVKGMSVPAFVQLVSEIRNSLEDRNR